MIASSKDARRERLARLRADLPAHGLDGAVICHSPNVRYLSGFSGSNGLLLVLSKEACLITDFRYEDQAEEEVNATVEVLLATDGVIAALADRLADRTHVRSLAFEAEHVTVRDRRELGERCASVLWEDMPPAVEGMRAIKAPDEVDRLAAAVDVAERALDEALSTVREGMAERELAAELEYRLAKHGSEGPAFDTIVASGERTALPHASPSERRLAEGDLLLLDFGATVDGYRSDITRTVVLGAARPWQREIHEHVLEAQAAALEALVPGCPAREVDRAARDLLEAVGLGERFGHSIGHGIGLEVHEGPRLYRESKDVIQVGNVVTVEPGVYLSGEGGVRVEEDVEVVDGGYRVLTCSSRALREL